MTQAELLQGLFDALDLILTLLSLFLALVSGYLAALFFFLGRAPFTLRAVAFALVTIGLVFLGGTAAVIQSMQNGLFSAWAKLPNPMIPLDTLRNPTGTAGIGGVTQQEIGVMAGWAIGALVYLTLAYLTFVYRWPEPERR